MITQIEMMHFDDSDCQFQFLTCLNLCMIRFELTASCTCHIGCIGIYRYVSENTLDMYKRPISEVRDVDATHTLRSLSSTL